jgi:hypothetical protein
MLITTIKSFIIQALNMSCMMVKKNVYASFSSRKEREGKAKKN